MLGRVTVLKNILSVLLLWGFDSLYLQWESGAELHLAELI